MPNTSTETPLSEVLVPLGVNEIKPYWRNPRNATDSDIAKVMQSIEEYGYQNPIIVDAEHVIIAGHTRYLAMRRLGWETIPVMVVEMDARAAKEYRIIDNRAGEFTQWDRTALVRELAQFGESPMLNLFFPEVDLTNDLPEIDVSALLPPHAPKEKPTQPVAASKMVTCPNCFARFDIDDAKVTEGTPDEDS